MAAGVLLLTACADSPDSVPAYDSAPPKTYAPETGDTETEVPSGTEAPSALPSSPIAAPPAEPETMPAAPVPETAAETVPPVRPLSAGEEAEKQLAGAVFDSAAEDGTFTYDLYDTYAAVTGFCDALGAAQSGEAVDLAIPAEYEGLPVRVIAADAFSAECGVLLSSVTLPEGLWRIESCAFRDQHRLTAVTLPDSLLSVGEMAFICRGGGEEHSPALTMGGRILTVRREGYVNEKRYDAAY